MAPRIDPFHAEATPRPRQASLGNLSLPALGVAGRRDARVLAVQAFTRGGPPGLPIHPPESPGGKVHCEHAKTPGSASTRQTPRHWASMAPLEAAATCTAWCLSRPMLTTPFDEHLLWVEGEPMVHALGRPCSPHHAEKVTKSFVCAWCSPRERRRRRRLRRRRARGARERLETFCMRWVVARSIE